MVVAGVALRAPLTRIPENLMKATVGVMLTSFGVFFVGEGIGVHWWHEDVSILVLVALFATLFVVCTWFLRHPHSVRVPHAARGRRGRDLGLVVGGGMLALGAVAAVLAAALLVAQADDAAGWAALLLVAGVVTALLVAVAGSRRLE